MGNITRREALAAIVTTSAVSVFSGNVHGGGLQASALAFAGKHEPKPLPFDAAKLKGISENLIRSHHENNYTGAVKALNAVEQRLTAMMNDRDLPPYVYGDMKRQELIRTGSVVLHERYFENLGGNGKADGPVLKAINRTWGNYELWEAEFKRTGNALGGGSGWTIFGYNFHAGEFHNYWSSNHATNAPFTVPLLVLDMYEHAYHMDYGAAAGKYVDAFMTNVNWETVNKRVEAITKL
jgi:superoxide dismutase, Fe-Mn family